MGNVLNSTGFANDIVVVRQPDNTLRCSAVNVRFPHQDDVENWNEKNVTVSINGVVPGLNFSLHELNFRNESNDRGFRFTSQCLKSMRLRQELNDITFAIELRGQDVKVKARIFLWRSDSQIVISDVDGTITKSDKRGIVMRLFGLDWNRDGNNGYKVIYLTGRPRNEGEATRSLLEDVQQGDKVLPKGPVIVSPDGLLAAVYREVWAKTQDKDFKIPALEQIGELFPSYHIKREEAGPFYAGFGNRPSDANTYLQVKIPCNRLFHLNHSKGGIQVKCDKTTLSAFFPNDFEGLSSFVDMFFPQERCCAVPAPHHSQTGARRAKEYFKSLLKPSICYGNWCTDSQ